MIATEGRMRHLSCSTNRSHQEDDMDQTPAGRRRIHGSRAQRKGLRLLWALPLVALAADSAAEDLAYVANLRASTVSVIDVPARRVVARVPVGAEPDGVAASPDG